MHAERQLYDAQRFLCLAISQIQHRAPSCNERASPYWRSPQTARGRSGKLQGGDQPHLYTRIAFGFFATIGAEFALSQYNPYIAFLWDIIEPIVACISLTDAIVSYFFWLWSEWPDDIWLLRNFSSIVSSRNFWRKIKPVTWGTWCWRKPKRLWLKRYPAQAFCI